MVEQIFAVPCRNLYYYAIKGQGAYKIEEEKVTQIYVSNRKENLRMLTSQFFFKNNDEFKDNPLIESMNPIGSSYKACLIAEGKAEFCIKFDAHTKEWDTAPSEVIIKEAGGVMSNMYGETNTYNRENVYNVDGFIIANNQEVLNKFKKTR